MKNSLFFLFLTFSFFAYSQDGSVDLTFNQALPTNHNVTDIAIQTDDKIFVTCYLSTAVAGIYSKVIRLNSNGTLDTTFNTGLGANQRINSIVIQSDGKILVAGAFTLYNGTNQKFIVRLNSDGSLDTSFNIALGPNDAIYKVFLQPDGKILIGGEFTLYNNISRNRIARLNSDGSLDLTFNPGDGCDRSVKSFAVQPDNKIIIGGVFVFYNNTLKPHLARLNADGTLDTSFNASQYGPNRRVFDLVLQPDGRIVIGGSFETYNDITAQAFARIESNGSLDTTFNPITGIVAAPNGISSPYISKIAIQPNGKYVVSGIFNGFNNGLASRIGRFNTDGTMDATLVTGLGLSPTDMLIYNSIEPVKILSNNKILVGGNFSNFNNSNFNYLVRLNNPSLSIDANNFNVDSIKILQNNNDLLFTCYDSLISQIKIYDLKGSLVCNSDNINDKSFIIKNLSLGKQILIVSVNTIEGRKVTKKIFFK